MPLQLPSKELAAILLAGLFILGLGFFLFRSGVFEQNTVEIIKDSENTQQSQITIEIAGAIEKPGVYELLASERVERLLIEAGGLSSEADREWVEKNLNRAAKLVDGQKIYIPKAGDPTSALRQNSGLRGARSGVAGVETGLINLNTASQSELDSLPGIGAVRAKTIVDNRPYASVNELVTKKVIPQSVFDKIKNEIVAP